jgi:hypothetical protein
MKTKSLAFLLAATVAATGSAQAALVATGVSSTSETTYNGTISTTDLLAGVTPTTTGTYAGDPNGIYDGVSVASRLTATSGNI